MSGKGSKIAEFLLILAVGLIAGGIISIILLFGTFLLVFLVIGDIYPSTLVIMDSDNFEILGIILFCIVLPITLLLSYLGVAKGLTLQNLFSLLWQKIRRK